MPKKGERMSASQRAKIAASRKRANAAKADASQPAANMEPKVEDVGGVAVEVAASQPAAAPKSLLDSVLGGIKRNPNGSASPTQGGGKSASSSAATGGDKEDNFLFTLVPVASGFLAYYSSALWAEEYKTCAPSKAEVSAVLTPVTRMLARRVNISLKETPDIRDTRLAATALLLYIVRAATLAIEISEQQEKNRAVNHAEHIISKGYRTQTGRPGNGTGDARTGTNQSADGRAIGSVPGAGDGRQQLSNEQSGPIGGAIETDAQYARRAIAEAFQQDKLYRTEHGML